MNPNTKLAILALQAQIKRNQSTIEDKKKTMKSLQDDIRTLTILETALMETIAKLGEDDSSHAYHE